MMATRTSLLELPIVLGSFSFMALEMSFVPDLLKTVEAPLVKGLYFLSAELSHGGKPRFPALVPHLPRFLSPLGTSTKYGFAVGLVSRAHLPLNSSHL